MADRLQSELEFHNTQAQARAADLLADPNRLRFTNNTYLDHETWIRPAFQALGNLEGKSVLDYGCGHGMASVVLARMGAQVTAFDLSNGYLQEAHQRAQVNDLNIHFLSANGERLPFASGSFHAIWGNAVLHHLDLRIAGQEILRVLRTDGIAIFCEPWGGNPILRLARSYLPYPGKHRTVDEEPLTQKDVDILRDIFPSVTMQGYQFFAMVNRVCPWSPLIKTLAWCDRVALATVPGLEQWCRYMVICLKPC